MHDEVERMWYDGWNYAERTSSDLTTTDSEIGRFVPEQEYGHLMAILQIVKHNDLIPHPDVGRRLTAHLEALDKITT